MRRAPLNPRHRTPRGYFDDAPTLTAAGNLGHAAFSRAGEEVREAAHDSAAVTTFEADAQERSDNTHNTATNATRPASILSPYQRQQLHAARVLFSRNNSPAQGQPRA